MHIKRSLLTLRSIPRCSSNNNLELESGQVVVGQIQIFFMDVV